MNREGECEGCSEDAERARCMDQELGAATKSIKNVRRELKHNEEVIAHKTRQQTKKVKLADHESEEEWVEVKEDSEKRDDENAGSEEEIGETSEMGNSQMAPLSLLGQVISKAELRLFDQESGTHKFQSSTPFGNVATAWGAVMRKKFPAPPGGIHNIKFTPKVDETPAAYLMRCKQEWEAQTGTHPHANQLHEWVFRSAVLEGTPSCVKTALKDNPDIPVSGSVTWERYLIHHMNIAKNKADVSRSEFEELKNLLIKLQVKKDRQKLIDKRKKNKEKGKQLVQSPDPELYYMAPIYNQPPKRQHQVKGPNRGGMGGQWGAGVYSGRGRGEGCFRCGQLNHQVRDCLAPAPPRPQVQCFTCNQWGHISRRCPQGQNPKTQRGGAQRGQGFATPHAGLAPNRGRQNPGQSGTQYQLWGGHELY